MAGAPLAGAVHTPASHRQRSAPGTHLPREHVHCQRRFRRKRGRPLGLRGKPKSKRRLWTPQQCLSASSEGVMLSVLRVGRPLPHAKVPVLLTTPSAREPEGSFSQALISHPDFTAWSPVRWKGDFCKRDADSAVSTPVTWAVPRDEWSGPRLRSLSCDR